MRTIPLVLLLPVLSGCEVNPCVGMCQQMQRWLDECGSTWGAEFREEGWHNLDDCYDAHWDADESARSDCSRRAESYATLPCY